MYGAPLQFLTKVFRSIQNNIFSSNILISYTDNCFTISDYKMISNPPGCVCYNQLITNGKYK